MLSDDCDVRLEVDGDSPPVFTDSDTVTGTVYVEVGEEVTCNGLVLIQTWGTHGRGNRDTGVGNRTGLFQGTWQPGETYEYPFEMDLPPGPYTYRGYYVNVDWRLEVNADIPWSLDPSDEREFVLEPGASEGYDLGKPDRRAYIEDQPDDHESGVGLGIFFSLIFLVPGIFVAILGATTHASAFALLFGLAFAAVGGYLLYMTVRNYFAEMQLGDVRVETSPDTVSPGDELRCRFAMEPNREVAIERAHAQIDCVEKATSGHGTDSTTYTQTLHTFQDIPEASRNTTLRKGESTEFRASLPIPESAPCTFEADDNRVYWRITFTVEIPSWPDWSLQRKILVRPPAEEGAPQTTSDEASASEEEAYAKSW